MSQELNVRLSPDRPTDKPRRGWGVTPDEGPAVGRDCDVRQQMQFPVWFIFYLFRGFQAVSFDCVWVVVMDACTPRAIIALVGGGDKLAARLVWAADTRGKYRSCPEV